jgi:pimeloyl-ACP methyl ester carboxylesterase
LRNVLYLHGFASSPRGRKAEALKGILEKEGFRVLAPDLNVPSFERLDFRAMSRMATWEMKKHFPAVVVGSSLGALVALAAGRFAPTAPLVLVAPALGFGRRWIEKLPPGESLSFFHHGEGRDLMIHRRFFEDMAAADWERDPPETPVVVIMGSSDESVPFGAVRRVWESWEASGRLREGSRFLEIPGGDHGLIDQVDLIAGEILGAAKQGLGPPVT